MLPTHVSERPFKNEPLIFIKSLLHDKIFVRSWYEEFLFLILVEGAIYM